MLLKPCLHFALRFLCLFSFSSFSSLLSWNDLTVLLGSILYSIRFRGRNNFSHVSSVSASTGVFVGLRTRLQIFMRFLSLRFLFPDLSLHFRRMLSYVIMFIHFCFTVFLASLRCSFPCNTALLVTDVSFFVHIPSSFCLLFVLAANSSYCPSIYALRRAAQIHWWTRHQDFRASTNVTSPDLLCRRHAGSGGHCHTGVIRNPDFLLVVAWINMRLSSIVAQNVCDSKATLWSHSAIFDSLCNRLLV